MLLSGRKKGNRAEKILSHEKLFGTEVTDRNCTSIFYWEWAVGPGNHRDQAWGNTSPVWQPGEL